MTDMGKKVRGYLGGTTRRIEVVAALALILTLSMVNSSNERNSREARHLYQRSAQIAQTSLNSTQAMRALVNGMVAKQEDELEDNTEALASALTTQYATVRHNSHYLGASAKAAAEQHLAALGDVKAALEEAKDVLSLGPLWVTFSHVLITEDTLHQEMSKAL